MQYLVLYILLAAICLPCVKINDYKRENVLSIMSKVNLLRGVFAIFIIFTHCSMAVNPLPAILFPLRKVSTFGVGFFFAVSGYGLAYSYDNKTDYLRGFLSRKLSKIIITAIVSRLVSEVVLYFTVGSSFSLLGIIRYMNWYIYSLIILYIVFFVVYKCCTMRWTRVTAICSVIVILTFVALFFTNNVYDIGRSYYISQWAFAIGICIFEFHDEFDCMIKNHFVVLNLFMALLLGGTFAMALKAEEYTGLDLISHNLMLLPFFYFVMVICRYFTFNNPVLSFLNRISFEIYLYQFMCLAILKTVLPEINVLYFLLSVVGTVVISWVINTISGMITMKKIRSTR